MYPYPVSTCPWLNSWPILPSFWWHLSTSSMADIQYSIYPLWCWGPGCYTSYSFCIATATLAASHGSPDHLIKTLGRWSSDAYQILILHSHWYYCGSSKPTHLTSISYVSSFPSCFCRVPQDFGSSGPGLPLALSPSFPLWSRFRQLGESPWLGMGAHGWVAGICQPWGQYSI